MINLEQQFEEVKEQHPNWTKEALRHVAIGRYHDEWYGCKTEALYEGKCPKCGKEFGEHEYSLIGKKFTCPRR